MIIFVTICYDLWFFDILLQDLFVVERGESIQHRHSTPIRGEPSKVKVSFSCRVPLLLFVTVYVMIYMLL